MLARKVRFLLSITVILAAKLLGAFVVYSRLATDGVLQTRWVEIFGPIFPTRFNFLYVFTHWDSGWFLWIAKAGYTDWVVKGLDTFPIWYSFFPGYPLLIRVTSLATQDYVLSAVLVSFIFGIAWVPVFEKLCEGYMSKPDALKCTLLAGFLPPVFLFTTVAYSESIFLFSTVTAWYFYEKHRMPLSSIFAAIATASRIVGIFVLVSFFVDSLRRRDGKAICWMTIPVGVFLAYAYYLFLKTGVWFAYLPVTPGAASLLGGLPKITGRPSEDLTFTFIVGFIALICFVTFRTWDLDWRLALYASISLLANLLLGFYSSYLRHLSFIFPAWMVLRIRSLLGLGLTLFVFYFVSIVMWIQFLSWKWVG
jgi:hypothetical protein